MNVAVLDLGIIILVAAALGIVARLLKQPTILAYIATGLVMGAAGLFAGGNSETLKAFSELGIMFLLFLVGLEINYASLRLVGRISVIAGLGQVLFTAGIGYLLVHALGFTPLVALYVAIALTFSSTVIVVKLLSDKRDLNSLYGKITVGILLVQDFLAIIILLLLAGMGRGESISAGSVAITVGEGALLFVFMLFLGRKILPFIFDKVARVPELLFLISLAWVFLVVAVLSQIGFSIEIAGFLAGLALANSSEHHQIAARIRPLRDFFILVFFVVLGASVALSNLSGLLIPIIVLSLFVLVGNPLIVLAILGLMGYRKRTSFLVGLTVAQISEFSLVLMALGLKAGHVDGASVALVTAVGIITITLSSYMIQFSDKIFKVCAPVLSFFERKRNVEHGIRNEEFRAPIVLIGFHRVGESIAAGLPRDRLLVIEFDPEIVKKLRHRGYQSLFGDISDSEIFEMAHIADAELVISTSPDIDDNLFLLGELRARSRRPKMVVRAETEKEAEILYREGADYVLFPHLTSGQYFGKTIAIDPEMKILEQLRSRDSLLLKNLGRDVV